MNIMKTNMLLLDNKIAKENAANSVAAMPIMTAAQPQAGMNALMFQGMRNLMADPELAQEVGVMKDDADAEKADAKSYVAPFSSNIAFQGKAKLAAIATLATMAAASLVSCKDEIKQEQTVIVDTKALAAAITQASEALQAKIDALQAQIAANENAQAQRDKEALELLKSQFELLNAKLAAHALSFDEFKALILGQNEAIITGISVLQQITKEEARAAATKIVTAIENGTISVNQGIAQLRTLLQENNDILRTINQTIKDASAKASEERDSLLNVANVIANNGKATVAQQKYMIAQNNALIWQNSIIIMNQNKIVKTIKDTGLSVNAKIQEVADSLGMKVDDLAAVVVRTGKSIEEVMVMSKGDIINAINANTAKLETTNAKLDNVNVNLNNVNLSVEDNTGAVVRAANDIKGILQEISAKIDELGKLFAQQNNAYKTDLANLTKIAKGIYNNGTATKAEVSNIKQQVSNINNDTQNMTQILIQIRDNLKNGSEVNIDYDKFKDMFNTLDIHQTASKDEIIAKIDQYLAGQNRIEVAVNKLGDKADYIALLVKNKTNDNADVIEAINNLSNANEANIAAATEQLAAKLDALIAKADAILNKMDNNAALLKQYGDQVLIKLGPNGEILQAIKANGAKIDITNMSLDELKAEVEKIKPELVKLNSSAVTANSYLDIISKRQLEIKQQIAELKALGGNGITKEELEELWKKHDAESYAKYTAFLNTIHAEDMDKADEIIEYLKKGNQTAADTYNFLINYADKNDLTMEQLRKLLQAVYDYLPNLVCKCNCQGHCDNNDSTHEGIIGILN